jgi:hypothetical protein
MTKKLAVPMLVLGLALYGGCGSSSSSNTGGSGGSTGGAGGSTGGSGGSTGGAGGSTGGSGGSTGGSGGSTGGAGGATGGAGGATDGGATDGSAGDGSAGDGSAGDGGMPAAVDWTMCTGGSKPGVSAMDFCTRYMATCGFDMTGGTATMERYKNMGECISQYTALPTTNPLKGQACVAYHLCVAGTAPDTNKTTHCPHPPQASLATPTGPCI